MKNKRQKGGVIPYFVNDDGTFEMMFMLPSGNDPRFASDVFQIAKGNIDKGEDLEAGAFREAHEELGLFLPNVSKRDFLGKFSNVSIWIAKIEDKNQFGKPHWETEKTEWMTPEQFAATGRDIHRPIVKAAARLIKKVTKKQIEEMFSNFLYEMSNYSSATTGLMTGVMLWVRTEPGTPPHTKFRFKIEHPQKGSAVLGFWGDEVQQVAGNWKLAPHELKAIGQFASLNKNAILSHIAGEIDSVELGIEFRNNKDKLQ